MMKNTTAPSTGWSPTAVSHLTAAVTAIGIGVSGLVTGHVGPPAFSYALIGGALTLLVGKGVFNLPPGL